MRISNKQKRGLERITGKPWDSWHPEAVRGYFSFTDRGQSVEVSEEAQGDLAALMDAHHWHSVTVELWKKDFRGGLLFLDDFLKDNHPKAYIQHVFEIYKDAMGFIPSRYKEDYDN